MESGHFVSYLKIMYMYWFYRYSLLAKRYELGCCDGGDEWSGGVTLSKWSFPVGSYFK